MNFSSVTTSPSVSSVERQPTEDEGKLVSFIICAIRSGIQKNELFAYLIQNKKQLDLVTRDKCFLRALEINESIETQCGKTGRQTVPMGLITEIVRLELMPVVPSQSLTATVKSINTHVESETELPLPILGEPVKVVQQSPDGLWLYVETARGEGWVPSRCIQQLG